MYISKIAMVIGISAVLVLCAAALIVVYDEDAEVEEIKNNNVTDVPLVICSENKAPQYDKLAMIAEKVEYVKDLSNVADKNKVIVVDEDNVVDKRQTLTNILNLIKQGNPVILDADTPALFDGAKENLRFSAFSDDAQLYCMATTGEGSIVCHSISGYADQNEALYRAYNWATSIESTYVNSTYTNGILGNDYYSYEVDCGDMGIMSGITIVSQIKDNEEDANYYLVHFNHQGINKGGHSKRGLDIVSEVGANGKQVIYDHQPINEVVTKQINFTAGVGAQAGTDGVGIDASFGASWTHDYSAVTYKDFTNLGKARFSVEYNIDECSDNGYDNFTVEPGMIVKVETDDGAYHAKDTYYAEFCDIVIHGAWHNQFKEFSETVYYTINPID